MKNTEVVRLINENGRFYAELKTPVGEILKTRITVKQFYKLKFHCNDIHIGKPTYDKE